MSLYVAGQNRGWRDAVRELKRSFSVTSGPERSETRVYLDTFDWRLFRAGFTFARVRDGVCLVDLASGEFVAQGAWHGKSLPRFARDLPTDDLRRFVSPVTDPRALLPVARMRVVSRSIEVRSRAGRLAGVIRSESVKIQRGKRVRERAGLLAETAPGGSSRPARDAVSRALAGAGYRATDSIWFEVLVRAAGCRPGDAAPRPRVHISPDTPARAALAEIFLHLHGVMRRNEEGIRDDIDSEFLHDYRVALRRTRTGLAELKGVLPADAAREFRERFRALAGPTGVVRDLDVHLGRRAQYVDRLPDALRTGLNDVFGLMERRREDARGDLFAVLASREYSTLMRDWKRALDSLASGDAVGIDGEKPAIEVGRRAIRRRYRRLREIVPVAEALDDAALHRARLDGKKLRYILEFFHEGLGRKAADTLAFIEKLQDALGEYNDLGVQLRFFRETLRARPVEDGATGEGAAAIGGVVALLEARRAKVRRQCERRLRALRELPSEGA